MSLYDWRTMAKATGKVEPRSREQIDMAIFGRVLPTRARNNLKHLGVTNMEQLLNTSEAEMRSSQEFGAMSVAWIKELLAEAGLKLKDDK
jgi:DNA-directed RNA polymerase alpha subunit